MECLRILSRIMRVVPGSSIEIGFEGIGERSARSNRALLNRGYTIIPRSFLLENTMPMESSAFLRASDLIMNGDLDCISPVGFDSWTRKLSINQNNVLLVSIRSKCAARYSEVVGSDNTGVWSGSVRIVTTCGKSAPWETIDDWVVGQELR